MVLLYLFLLQYAYIKMILLAIHIISIGALVGITAHIAYSSGKKKGFSIYLKEHKEKPKN